MKFLNFPAVIVFAAMALCSCDKDDDNSGDSSYKGVLINGVTWAECNLDGEGVFAAAAEDYGKYFQWNRKKAWSSDNATGWNSTPEGGNVWAAANDPCPAGWRVPTPTEMESLLDAAKVTGVWETSNGVTGARFTDKSSGKSIFLPDAGILYPNGTYSGGGQFGFYWSNTIDPATTTPWNLPMILGSIPAALLHDAAEQAESVRCVRK